MIKYKKKVSTLYGISVLASAFINLNLWFLLKIFSIETKRQLYIINFLVCLILYIEIFLASSLMRGYIDFSIDNLSFIFVFVALLIMLIRNEFPYWEDDWEDVYSRKTKVLFTATDIDSDEPNKIIMLYFNKMYEDGYFLKVVDSIIKKISFNVYGVYCCFPDVNGIEELRFEGVKFAIGYPPEDDDWITVTEKTCYEYLRLACERYVAFHPDDTDEVNGLLDQIINRLRPLQKSPNQRIKAT